MGWLKGSARTQVSVIAILVGLGHSVLAMSGEESLAQVNGEIASPKLKNLGARRIHNFCSTARLFTSLVSFFAVMLIPDHERVHVHLDNLIGGLAMNVVGPLPLRLLFHAFVVVVGDGDISRGGEHGDRGLERGAQSVAEDGVLPDAVPASS